MVKILLSVIESIVCGIISWKVAIPVFIALANTEVGNWAYLGLISFLLIIIASEYASYRENKLTWFMSKILGNLIK